MACFVPLSRVRVLAYDDHGRLRYTLLTEAKKVPL